ncbi:MAG TPA: Gfo/Idh/MocA family oxidoreductase [Sedimentisphaerales bacterium]|nr:Gfo/Idh/MocA family oxidoreductase [Sedimentisphaerales bacterium]
MKDSHILERREFLKSAAAGLGFFILPSGTLSAGNSPSNKLNVAMIGTWGRADAHFGSISSENVVALCDVDENHIAHAAKKFPKAKTYVDWRKCLDQKDIDAVICCTTDHTHAFIANWAMNRGMHVYCEKPLGNTVEEARIVRANYLKNRNKIATQVGTQRHEKPNFERVRELVKDGAIGQLTDAYAWGDRQIRRPGYPPAKGEPPKTLHYDLWIGPSPFHPYSPEYFKGGPGMNCLSWNMYWDFGTGQVGDMGSHTIDLVWNAVDAGLPTTAQGEGEKYNPEVSPVELHTSFDYPANDWRGPITVHWYQGGMMPRSPKDYVDLNKTGHGAMFKGSKGYVVCDYDSRILLPFGDDADLTYYNRRNKDDVMPPMGHFQKDWVDACKSDLKTHCDFDYGGTAIEMMLLGLVAYRVGKKLDYDGEKGRVTNSDQANDLLRRDYRPGWTLNG